MLAKTLFREEVIQYQKDKSPTKSTSLKEGLIVLGLAVVAPLFLVELPFVALLAIRIFGSMASPGTLRAIFFVIWFLLVALAVVKVLRSFLRRTKPIICPKCKSHQAIYASIREYLCTECGSLMLLGEDKTQVLEVSDCPYCHLRTFVTRDFGQFVCSNCGVNRNSAEVTELKRNGVCPQCKTAIPGAAFYCISCGCIQLDAFQRTIKQKWQFVGGLRWGQFVYWEAGRGPIGHFHYARALLETINGMLPKIEAFGILGRQLRILSIAL